MDPFDLLGLPPHFALDAKVLDRAHRELGKRTHPDAHVSTGSGEGRARAEASTEANAAFRTLRDPVTRAEALFRRAGFPLGDGHEPKPSPAFLMEILDLREALSDARGLKKRSEIEALVANVGAARRRADGELVAAFDRGSLPTIAPYGALSALRYYRRFLEEAEASLDELDE